MRRRSPYNPSAKVHDRRAKEIGRGIAGHTAEVEIEDPFEVGAKISAIRSTRDDPLADHLARGHIDDCQYHAGRQFQWCYGRAERGPRAIRFEEAVDGNPPREALTDRQIAAWKNLGRAYRQLGADGTALVHDVLISAMTAKQIAAARGLAGQEWERYFSKRFYETLNTLAIVYGFATR